MLYNSQVTRHLRYCFSNCCKSVFNGVLVVHLSEPGGKTAMEIPCNNLTTCIKVISHNSLIIIP